MVPERVAAVTEAFAAGDVQGALEATAEEVADRIMVAGTPEDWVQWLAETYAPAGLNHALVSFTDPEETFLLPESIETLEMYRGELQSHRTRQEFSNYRRFVTGARVVK